MGTLSSMLLQKGHLVPDLLEQRYREHIYMYLYMYICESFFFLSLDLLYHICYHTICHMYHQQTFRIQDFHIQDFLQQSYRLHHNTGLH